MHRDFIVWCGSQVSLKLKNIYFSFIMKTGPHKPSGLGCLITFQAIP